MKKSYLALGAALLLCSPFQGMAKGDEGYKFKTIVSQKVTPVKNQASTGTCWCFATTSFFEAELLRMGKGEYDLSEMFIVRQKYMNQLADNFLRRGRGNISEGSITSSWITAFNQVGIVPEEVYTGINYNSDRHNHSELTDYIEAIGDMAVKRRSESEQYKQLVNSLFDIYLGKLPEKFTYKGKEYTPKSFGESLGINTDDYVKLTSFTHKPYYREMEIEIPDNWEHDRMYNLPLDELMEVMNHTLESGYTLCWDGDVSEKGFSFTNGVAINPEVEKEEDLSASDMARWGQMSTVSRLQEVFQFKRPYPEVKVTPEVRQIGYETFKTTDDHLMHVTGLAKDQNGTIYYITKNSWGTERNNFGGYLNMSESYVRAKTIYVMMHKDSLTPALRKKLGL